MLASARLWSLWDMKEIVASNLYLASTHIEKLEVLIQEWEKPTLNEFGSPDEVVSSSLRHNIAGTYKSLVAAAEALGAPVTKMAAERARKRLLQRKDAITFRALKGVNADIKSRLQDEIRGVRFYCLTPGAADLYNATEPLFGKEVEARIGKASDDIIEGAKCFAVGRYTASVFHMMRAMEAAVQRLSSHLGIDNVEREWGKLLSDIGTKVETMPKGDTRNDWSRVHANLYHVKQAWRNDTMHPKATYTEEEAREVFDAMKAFMRNLANMLPPAPEEVIG